MSTVLPGWVSSQICRSPFPLQRQKHIRMGSSSDLSSKNRGRSPARLKKWGGPWDGGAGPSATRGRRCIFAIPNARVHLSIRQTLRRMKRTAAPERLCRHALACAFFSSTLAHLPTRHTSLHVPRGCSRAADGQRGLVRSGLPSLFPLRALPSPPDSRSLAKRRPEPCPCRCMIDRQDASPASDR